MTGTSHASERKSVSAMAQNGCEHRYKHLIAPLIPITLIMLEEQATPEIGWLLMTTNSEISISLLI
jgi:hypothetical protein